MLKKLFLAAALLCSVIGYSQKNGDYSAVAASITKEAFKLFYLERASWVGTDVMMANFDQKEMTNFGGYFSYKVNDNSYTCLFFSRDEEDPSVLFSVTFDTTFSEKTAKYLFDKRAFTTNEKALFDIRRKATKMLSTDDLFESYKNTNFNVIPMIEGNKKMVYVLTGTTEHGVIILGNDYYIEFNDKLEVKEKKKLHQNIIKVPTTITEGTAVASMHNHQSTTGDYITPTDVCTLMLYSPFVETETHIVMSDKAVSIWNFKTKSLNIISRKVFDKIAGDKN